MVLGDSPTYIGDTGCVSLSIKECRKVPGPQVKHHLWLHHAVLSRCFNTARGYHEKELEQIWIAKEINNEIINPNPRAYNIKASIKVDKPCKTWCEAEKTAQWLHRQGEEHG